MCESRQTKKQRFVKGDLASFPSGRVGRASAKLDAAFPRLAKLSLKQIRQKRRARQRRWMEKEQKAAKQSSSPERSADKQVAMVEGVPRLGSRTR